MGDALQGVVQHDRQMIARPHVLAANHDVAPAGGIACDVRRGRSPGPTRSSRAACPPPPPTRAACPAGSHAARRPRCERRVRPLAAPRSRRRPTARHRDRAGGARRRLGLRHAPGRLRPGAEARIESARAPRAGRARRRRRRGARTGGAPVPRSAVPARRGPPGSRPRTPAACGPDRYPRSAAAGARPGARRVRHSAAPRRRGRDAAARWGWARSGKRVAWRPVRPSHAADDRPSPCSPSRRPCATMIRTEEDLAAALSALVEQDPALAPLRAAVGNVAPRRRHRRAFRGSAPS